MANNNRAPLSIEDLFQMWRGSGYDRPSAVGDYCERASINISQDEIDQTVKMHARNSDAAEKELLIKIFGSEKLIPDVLMEDDWDT